jgi:hypothetical protein
MEPYEWAFWMEGKAAEQDSKGPDGAVLGNTRETRAGGSVQDRMGAVACWNAVMDEHDYMDRKWNQFIEAKAVALSPCGRGSPAVRALGSMCHTIPVDAGCFG